MAQRKFNVLAILNSSKSLADKLPLVKVGSNFINSCPNRRNDSQKRVWSSDNQATAQKMKFSIKDFFSKCHQIRRKRLIWSHLLKKSLMGKFIFLYSEPCYMRVRRSDVIKWNVFVSAVTVTCVLFNLYVFEFPF